MNLPKATIVGKEKYLYVSPQICHELAFSLCLAINKQIKEGKIEKPEIIIGIAKGSYAWLKILSDWLNIDNVTAIRVVHYTDIGQRLPQPTILQTNLPRIDKKRVLLFDNVADTGKTIKMAYDFLNMCGADKIFTASLFYKKISLIKPDFYSAITDAWIIFYFEIVETVKLLGSKWINEKVGFKEIKNRLLTINIPPQEVDEALKLLFNYPV